MGHDNTDLSIAEVVTLLAGNAVTLVVDTIAMGVSTSNATALHSKVESVDVARHAVKFIFIPEETSVAGLGGADNRVLGVCSDDHQA